MKSSNKLTVLSYGAGQDSTAILYKLIYDQEFRTIYAPNDLIVIMADTGNEHPETDLQREEAQLICQEEGIPFFFLKCTSKYYTGDWNGGYINFLKSGNRIGSKAFPKTCTDRLKIQPIYKFLEDHIHRTYNTKKHGRKSALKEFTQEQGKIRVLIGISKGEEKRVATIEDNSGWMSQCVQREYPLIAIGAGRHECQNIIRNYGHKVPVPSNCILCPWMSLQELLYLFRFNIDWFNKWAHLEHNKLITNSHKGEKNMGVWGKKTLPEMLEEAKKKYGHMSDKELAEYRFSHGHCVKSKY